MDKFKQDINTFLVDAFNSLLQIEEDFLAKGQFNNITVKEMHLIDTVVNMRDNNIAKNIARKMNITQSTLTTAVNTLEKKGMLVRKTDEKDRRIVKIYPTEKAMQVVTLVNYIANFCGRISTRTGCCYNKTDGIFGNDFGYWQ